MNTAGANIPDILTHQMNKEEQLRSYVADKVLEAYNGSYKPHCLTPSHFEQQLTRGNYQTIVKDGFYSLITMSGNGDRFLVTESMPTLEDHLKNVYYKLTNTKRPDIKEFTQNDAVKRFAKSFGYYGVEYELIMPGQKLFDRDISFYIIHKSDDENIKAGMAEYNLGLFDTAKGRCYVLEI